MIKRKQYKRPRSSTESGFTIIESLLAILIVAILLAAIAPVIVLSVATRVQAKRVEQATLAAKTFIDGVRTGEIPPPKEENAIAISKATKDEPRSISNSETVGDYLINIGNMPPPTKDEQSKDRLYCFKKDGNIEAPGCHDTDIDNILFLIQAKQIKVETSKPNEGYRMGIRVYRKEAFVDTNGDLKASDGYAAEEADKKVQQLTYTGGAGNTTAPLVEMSTDIVNKTTTFQSLCDRLGLASGENCN